MTSFEGHEVKVGYSKVCVYWNRASTQSEEKMKAEGRSDYYCLEDVFALIPFYPDGGPGTYEKLKALLRVTKAHEGLWNHSIGAYMPGRRGENKCFKLQRIFDAIEQAVKDDRVARKSFAGFDWGVLTEANFEARLAHMQDHMMAIDKEYEKLAEKRSHIEAFRNELEPNAKPSKRARLSLPSKD